jgi:hypothetical protein
MALLAIVVVSLLLLLVTRWYGDCVYERAAFLALAGHVFVALVVIPRLPYRWDIGQFHARAMEVAAGTFTTGWTTVSSFAAFQALLYTLFASETTTLGVVNGLLAVLLVVPISYLAESLYTTVPRSTPTVTLLVLFFPLPFLFLTIPMRDALTVLLFCSLLALVVRAVRTGTPRWGLPAVPLWGMLFLLRTELALITLLAVTAMGAVGSLRRLDAGLSLGSITIVLGGIACLGFGLFAELLYSFERANQELLYRSSGGAVYLDGMSYGSWFDFLLAAPARGIYFQFAPFPLHVESVFHLLGFVGTLLITVLFVSAVRSLVACEYDEMIAVFLVVVYMAGIVGYGTINSNFGTNVRHRMAFDFLLVVFASPVLHQWWLRLRSWISIAPGQPSHEDEQEREAQELHRSAHRRSQDANETQ